MRIKLNASQFERVWYSSNEGIFYTVESHYLRYMHTLEHPKKNLCMNLSLLVDCV